MLDIVRPKENIVRTTLLQSVTTLLGVLTLVTSFSITAENNAVKSSSGAYTEKKTAEEFWTDFKQDSKQTWKNSKAAFKDGWIESKLATALSLNKYLNPYQIDIRVDNNVATLEGKVHSDIDKELAENIALGVEGIDLVTNRIHVVEKPINPTEPTTPKGRSFAQYVTDVSTTAAIKTELIASANVEGLAIDVDTLNNQVTLSGKVDSSAEKALAQAIAAKHGEVEEVINNLEVKS